MYIKEKCTLGYSKKEKKLLRNLINLAYERELSSELNKLELSFTKYNNKEINAFDLDNIIHKYHNGISKDLYKKYSFNFSDGMPYMIVASSVKTGLLKKEEVDKNLIGRINEIIKTFYS